MAQIWDIGVQGAVAAGSDRLRVYLQDNPPIRSDQVFRDLLQYIYNKHSHDQVLADELYNVVFHRIRSLSDSPRYGRRPRDDARNAESQRRRPWVDPNLSLYAVFRLSMLDKEWQSAYTPPDIPTHSPLTQLIWDKAQEELYSQGAISACAEFGLNNLLTAVLGKLKENHGGQSFSQEQLDILFQIPPDSDKTAFGAAISNRRLECFDTLYLSVHGAGKHMYEAPNVVNRDDQSTPLVHWSLEQIRAGKGMGVQIGALEKEEDLLQRIINVEPLLLTQHDVEGLPPYVLALQIEKDIRDAGSDHGYNGLSSVIRNAIYQQLEDPEDWRRALYAKSDPGKEVSLDLSDFNYDPYFFEHFANDLETFDSQLGARGKSWEFESTLLYLILPNLRRDCKDYVLAKFLLWLKGKKVSRILKLKLPDSTRRYTHQFVYQHILSLFEIDEFDWARLDVNLDGFGSQYFWATWLNKISPFQSGASTAPFASSSTGYNKSGVLRMHVYSHEKFSNNLEAFKTPRLFCYLENIQTIYLNLVSEPVDSRTSFDLGERQERAQSYRHQIAQDLQGGEVRFDATKNLLTWEEFTLHPIAVNKKTVRSKLIADLTHCREFLTAFVNMRKASLNPSSKTEYCHRVFKEQRVKVAIIDNGADQMSTAISANIVRGMSFVRSGYEARSVLPWYTPAHPHGTQMADLIRSVNPWCDLFPLRVASLDNDVKMDAAIEAIEWALEQKVDIISISWIIKTKVQNATKFRNAIQKAADQNVLVICATADVGAQASVDVWPANCSNVVTISAANAYGLPMPWSHRDVHAMLHGDQVIAGGPNYMRLPKDARASGSSVATALASGLASLCLFLARMANEDGTGEQFKQRLVMLAVFRSMQADDLDRVIELSDFFDETFRPRVGFQRGQLDPPTGLHKFLFQKFAAVLSDDLVVRRTVAVRRRSLSTT